MAERRVKMKAEVIAYHGRYIWQRFWTTTMSRAEWARDIIEGIFPKRRVTVRKASNWHTRSCLTVGKFYRGGRLIRRIYFDNPDAAQQFATVWKSYEDTYFRYTDLTKAWRRSHADDYKWRKEKARRA